KVIKGKALADQLAATPLSGLELLDFEFPDEDLLYVDAIPSWILFFDGSCNIHGSRDGIILCTPDDDVIPKSYCIGFPCTNNIFEYEALIK
ncbi:hypothetical protein KI387_026697, partial [Taxus chinensis]